MGIAKIQGLGVLLLIGLGALVMFLVYSDLISIKPDGYACFGGRKFYDTGDKKRLMAIGSLNIYYKVHDYGCEHDRQYSPEVYKVVGGELVPKDH